VGEVEDLEGFVGEGGGEGPLEERRSDGGVAAEDAEVGVALFEGGERGGEGWGEAVAAEKAGAGGDGEEEKEGEADVVGEEDEGFDLGREEGDGDGVGFRFGSREGRANNRSQSVSRRSTDSRVDEASWARSRMSGRPTPDRRRWVRKVR
jgi:hypothetical protein